MLRDDRDVGAWPEHVVGRAQQLGADHHREEPTGEQEQEDADRVLQPDDLVLLGHAEVPTKTRVGLDRCGLATDQLQQGVVERPDPGEPSDDPEDEGEHDRDVVGAAVRRDRVAARDEVPGPVAQNVAEDEARHRPQQVGAHPARPLLTDERAVRERLAWIEPRRRVNRHGFSVTSVVRRRDAGRSSHVISPAARRRTSRPRCRGPPYLGSSRRLRRWHPACRSRQTQGAGRCSPRAGARSSWPTY